MDATATLGGPSSDSPDWRHSWMCRPTLWMGMLLALGLFLRLAQYFSNASVWHDEGWLILNLLAKDYDGLLGKLEFDQAAPPLFLWIERAMIEWVGDSTYALRLVPVLASCAGLLLLAQAAGKMLRPWGCLAAVLLCGCSERMICHTSEVKPYSIDVCIAALFATLFVQMQRHSTHRQLVVWTVVTPLSLAVSYSAFFLCGGLLLALLPGVWRQRTPGVVVLYGLLALVVAGVSGLLLTGPIAAQDSHNLHQLWQNAQAFPRWDRPWTVPFWMVWATVVLCDHACRPAGGCLVGIAVIGAVVLWRQGRQTMVVLLLGPVALNLLASLLGRYPYTGSRVTLYVLPAVCLLVGAGLPATWNWLRNRRPQLAPLAIAPLAAALVLAGYRFVAPSSRADCSAAAALIQAQRRPGDVVVGDDPSLHYYFRHEPAGYHRMDRLPLLTGQRMWVAATHVAPPDWSRFVETAANDGWKVAERTNTRRTEVLLMVREPPLQQARAAAPPEQPVRR